MYQSLTERHFEHYSNNAITLFRLLTSIKSIIQIFTLTMQRRVLIGKTANYCWLIIIFLQISRLLKSYFTVTSDDNSFNVRKPVVNNRLHQRHRTSVLLLKGQVDKVCLLSVQSDGRLFVETTMFE